MPLGYVNGEQDWAGAQMGGRTGRTDAFANRLDRGSDRSIDEIGRTEQTSGTVDGHRSSLGNYFQRP